MTEGAGSAGTRGRPGEESECPEEIRLFVRWPWLHYAGSDWHGRPDARALAITVLEHVAWERRRGEFRGVELAPGQMFTSRRGLAKMSGLTERRCRTAVEQLAKGGFLTEKPSHGGTLLTVCNWETYNRPKARSVPRWAIGPTVGYKPTIQEKEKDKEKARYETAARNDPAYCPLPAARTASRKGGPAASPDGKQGRAEPPRHVDLFTTISKAADRARDRRRPRVRWDGSKNDGMESLAEVSKRHRPAFEKPEEADEPD